MTTSAPTDVELAELSRHSVELILRLQDPSGAYPASPTFSAYQGYSWFRDGAFIADAVSAYGEEGSASRFHDWCSGILTARSGRIREVVDAAAAGSPVPDERMLGTRFTFDGAEGSDEWWDFQLDGYGTWLWAVVEHAQRHELGIDRWLPAIELAVDYLASSWERPCFDWWEEHAEHVHVSTLGCIAAGLRAAQAVVDPVRADACADAVARIRALIARNGVVSGHLAKWLGSTDVDASLAALVAPLRVYPADGAVGASTIAALDEQLTVDGGVHRYLLDTFFGGGQWPLLSCFLGLAYADAGDTARARELLEWAASTVTADGDLPEQVPHHLLFPDRRQEWIDRWGTVATPLLWSHAMFVRLQVRLEVGR
ncbi:glycoside hydrolase family 15 protein [Salinibacterium soli]|uniref:Glycoside hydrolase family 15 protein n=1 Tax=Antiquaquibacter soli TaxID=3064523 RepID=A0ABT9BP07_9MICO|nr:glycoside hydrolase family 15 protein [Protaetiibacter sp. WY-16]MDO7882309.1 glycoside hydrolase family 15 protein [Protaetiibacter sp. WY-16]